MTPRKGILEAVGDLFDHPEEGLLRLRDAWTASWPQALDRWSRFVKLREPLWCLTRREAAAEGLAGSFAMIRLTDHSVVVSLPVVQEKKVEPFGLEVLAHEIGHHVLCPGDLTDQGRMVARMRRALPDKTHVIPLIANVYADLLINDRLQRSAGLDMAAVYKECCGASSDPFWTFYMRTYEVLWGLAKGSLAAGAVTDELDGDARLGARLLRAYAGDWVAGSGRFAALCYPYLLEDDAKDFSGRYGVFKDMGGPDPGADPSGLAEIEEGEDSDAVHPALDEGLSGGDVRGPRRKRPAPASAASGRRGGEPGQYREPFEYGEILRALGLDLSGHDAAVRYYRERALPHLIPFPSRRMPQAREPQLEGTDLWDAGSALEELDLFESLAQSPTVIPGVTTLRRLRSEVPGQMPEKEPVDLDLYVDCSGSMPNPQTQTSYLALAGAIVSLSALRAGSRVQATLWSGAGEFETTEGFVRDERRILRILTGFLGDGTAFPIHMLRDTYEGRKPGSRKVHILVISDSGVTTMFERDEKGASGWDISRAALAEAGGGGTMVLNIPPIGNSNPYAVLGHGLGDAARVGGWDIHAVSSWEQLVGFARSFSRKNYGEDR